MNDKELMEGLERSKKDVKEGRIYELKNVADPDEIREDLIILHKFEHPIIHFLFNKKEKKGFFYPFLFLFFFEWFLMIVVIILQAVVVFV